MGFIGKLLSKLRVKDLEQMNDFETMTLLLGFLKKNVLKVAVSTF